MPTPENKLAYQKKRNAETNYADQRRYAKKALKRIAFDLNRTTDRDIIEWLEMVPNKQGYLKDLIRRDMESKS